MPGVATLVSTAAHVAGPLNRKSQDSMVFCDFRTFSIKSQCLKGSPLRKVGLDRSSCHVQLLILMTLLYVNVGVVEHSLASNNVSRIGQLEENTATYSQHVGQHLREGAPSLFTSRLTFIWSRHSISLPYKSATRYRWQLQGTLQAHCF